ncbi:MAG TPA: cupin domain-containing protein [Gemmatimonadales bacterium]|nr:cupin domain-containing protein [Gemmatimonadales bacterium]
MRDRSKVIKCREFRWNGVDLREYKTAADDYRGVTRQTLLGEQRGEEPLNFLTRYFEVQPGGYSSLEFHRHPHAVIVIRGTGHVQLGEETYEISPFDCVYVAPGTKHQFRATGNAPLGFVCIVDRVRDRPQAVEPPKP